MARRRRIKTLPNARRDFISQLPAEVKDKIMERLPIRDGARIALLSTQWRDVWLGHDRLVFDMDFFETVQKWRHGNKGRTLVKVISNILFFRAGPVKKFTLQIEHDIFMPKQSDFNRWCLFLSRNGIEELNIRLYESIDQEYKLPFCIVSCPTIKQLRLEGPFIDLPVNSGCIFPSITSLHCSHVEFKCNANGIASTISIPNLEKLAFEYCEGIDEFEISSPKLEILSVIVSTNKDESTWLMPHFKAIKTLWLSGSDLKCMDVSMFPTAINLQVMKLYELCFVCERQLTVAMQLLNKLPNLCELGISEEKESGWDDYEEAASRLLEDPDGCFIIQDWKMLKKIKFESFNGYTPEMLFVKMLLSKSPALERFVMDTSEVNKILRKLLSFPRASPKAEIVCMKYNHSFMRKDWLATHGFSLG